MTTGIVIVALKQKSNNSISKSTDYFVGFACRTTVLPALRLRVLG